MTPAIVVEDVGITERRLQVEGHRDADDDSASTLD
jgi:hypothetical protein